MFVKHTLFDYVQNEEYKSRRRKDKESIEHEQAQAVGSSKDISIKGRYVHVKRRYFQ